MELCKLRQLSGGATMSEMGDTYDPGPWKGYDFGKARMHHADPNAGRGYSSGSSSKSSNDSMPATPVSLYSGKSLDNLVPEKLITQCRSPLIVVVDGTGSMGDFPKVMFKKLPLLDLGINDYLEDSEIAFAVVGDAGANDQYPFQVQPFTKGKGLQKALDNLALEGGGGSNEQESYDLAALYFARHVEMPKATNPVLLWVCDEGIYPTIDPTWAKSYARTDLPKGIKSKEAFDELRQKFSVYCIRKHYNNGISGDKMIGSNLHIHKQWQEYIGPDRIAILNNPERVVDVTFGLLADATGKKDFFQTELTYRQKPEQVEEVMKSMLTVGRDKSKSKHGGKSVMIRPPGTPAKESKSLL